MQTYLFPIFIKYIFLYQYFQQLKTNSPFVYILAFQSKYVNPVIKQNI